MADLRHGRNRLRVLLLASNLMNMLHHTAARHTWAETSPYGCVLFWALAISFIQHELDKTYPLDEKSTELVPVATLGGGGHLSPTVDIFWLK